MGTQTAGRRLVMFDTNVVERFYIAALLRGERIRDFALLTQEGYVPALDIKSLFEILQHAKAGDKGLPWMRADVGYPGGVKTEGLRIVRRLQECPSGKDQECPDGVNPFYWFGLCEEWIDRDWDAFRQRVETHIRREDRDRALLVLAVQREFLEWRCCLQGFCDGLHDLMQEHMHIVMPNAETSGDRLMSLMLELSRSSLVPNEDLEILASALLHDVVAFVTEERAIRMQFAASIAPHHQIAFVHPMRLREAMSEGFAYRWSESYSVVPRDDAQSERGVPGADG